MNERMKILKLLEDGKISAEEAERLFEALSASDSERRRGFWGQPFEFISEIIPGIFESSFKDYAAVEQSEYAGKNRIKIKGISGNIDLTGCDGSIVIVEKEGLTKIYEEGDTLIIKAVSGNLKASVPKNIGIRLKGVAGNINLKNLCGKVEVSSVSGDIRGTGLGGVFEGEFISGNAELEYESVDDISINSRAGNIAIRLSKDTAAEIEVWNKYGNITCDLPLKDVVRKQNYLRGVLNSSDARISVKSKYGDVTLSLKTTKD